MKSNSQVTVWNVSRVPIASVLFAMLLAGGSSALASGNDGSGHSVYVSGNSTYSDCGLVGSDLAITMTGDLEGCLSVFVQGFSCRELGDFALYSERGQEVFVGTLRGKQGRFRTSYTVEGAYAKGFCQSFDFSLQLAGGCSHKVYGRSGVFKEAEGLLSFLDVVAGVTGDPVTGAFTPGTGANNFLYFGSIRLDGNN
ncbi:MAG: hypothetical protein ACRER4_01460 [Steroidobacteraceae bacterium]